MSNKSLSEALGIEFDGIEYDDNNSAELFDNYVPWGGGGAGSKNGHYGCKHTEQSKKMMSEKKKGTIPWNKNKKGLLIHKEESKKMMSEKLSGSANGRAILNENSVNDIIKLYLSQPFISEVGNVQSNGIKMSYIWAFSKMISEQYNTTPAAIKRLLEKKNWKHVWEKYELSNKN